MTTDSVNSSNSWNIRALLAVSTEQIAIRERKKRRRNGIKIRKKICKPHNKMKPAKYLLQKPSNAIVFMTKSHQMGASSSFFPRIIFENCY